MPQITWQSVGDLDFSDSNDLRVKGSEMMESGATTITDTFKEIATKNAAIDKEDRDFKFAGAVQGMALAENDKELRGSFESAMQIDGIGADNVLGLTQAYKNSQKDLMARQSGQLGIDGQRLDLATGRLDLDGKTRTHESTVGANNAKNTDSVVQSNYNSVLTNNKMLHGIPEVQAASDASGLILKQKTNDLAGRVLDKTGATEESTAINNAASNNATSIENLKSAGAIAQSGNKAKIAISDALTREAESKTTDYYSDKIASEKLKAQDAIDLRKAKIKAEQSKSAAAKQEFIDLEIKTRKRETIAASVNSTILQSEGKNLNVTQLYGKFYNNLKGAKLTSKEYLDAIKHLNVVADVKGSAATNIKSSSLEQYVKKSKTNQSYYDSFNAKDLKVVSDSMAMLKATGTVLVQGVPKVIPKNQHKDYLDGLLSHMSAHTRKLSPFTGNEANAVEGLEAFHNARFALAKSEV